MEKPKKSLGDQLKVWLRKGMLGWAAAVLVLGYSFYRGSVDDARYAAQQSRAQKAEAERDTQVEAMKALHQCVQNQKASIEDFLTGYSKHLADVHTAASKYAEVGAAGTEAARKPTDEYVAAAKGFAQFIREWHNVQSALATMTESSDISDFEHAADAGDLTKVDQARLELEHTSAEMEPLLDRALGAVEIDGTQRVCGKF